MPGIQRGRAAGQGGGVWLLQAVSELEREMRILRQRRPRAPPARAACGGQHVPCDTVCRRCSVLQALSLPSLAPCATPTRCRRHCGCHRQRRHDAHGVGGQPRVWARHVPEPTPAAPLAAQAALLPPAGCAPLPGLCQPSPCLPGPLPSLRVQPHGAASSRRCRCCRAPAAACMDTAMPSPAWQSGEGRDGREASAAGPAPP